MHDILLSVALKGQILTVKVLKICYCVEMRFFPKFSSRYIQNETAVNLHLDMYVELILGLYVVISYVYRDPIS